MKSKNNNAKIRRAVKRATGIKVPKNIHLDHKVARADGGTDNPKNLQWLKKSEHQRKTAAENKARSRKRK